MPNVPFWLAKQHYAELRRAAYHDVVRNARAAGAIPVPLRLADTNEETLAVWRSTWRDAHPSGFGNWNWEPILRRAWRRPSAFHVAVWSGEQLCGLGVGRLSKRRLIGIRHTISLHCVESAHDAGHSLRGWIAVLVISAAEGYGRLMGASRIRLIEPLPGIMHTDVGLGFEFVHQAGHPVYCERRILP